MSTHPFDEKRYQSDLLTFERQQFEAAARTPNTRDSMFDRDSRGLYKEEAIYDMWEGWKLARGIEE